MDPLKRYDDLFSRLLYDRDFRERVRAGDWSMFGELREAFSGIDLAKLDKIALDVRDGLIQGSPGVLGVGRAFPGAIAALGGGPEAVVERYLAAHQQTRDIDGTGRRAGVGALESFFGWAEGQLARRPADRCRAQHEFAAALIATLASTPRPGFLVSWPHARSGPRGWRCVLDAARPLSDLQDQPEQPVIYIGVDGRYATGRSGPALATIVLEGVDDPPRWVGEQLAKLDPAALDAERKALAARGLA